MTDDELDLARADEAARIKLGARMMDRQVIREIAAEAARLAREGWKPEDPMLKEALALAQAWHDGFMDGLRRQPWDDASDWAILTGQDYAKLAIIALLTSANTDTITRAVCKEGGWRPMSEAPRDGTPIWARCVHQNYSYAKGDDKLRWVEVVLAQWIDHNGGGWTWHGIAGEFAGWRPTNKPGKTLLPAPPSVEEDRG
jgi:hypothetical protein